MSKKQMKPQNSPKQNDKSAKKLKFNTYENLDKIGEIAVYYGFTPAPSPSITKADLDTSKEIISTDYINDDGDKNGKLPLHVEEKIAIVRTYFEQNMQNQPQPVMLYFKDPCKGFKKSTNYNRYADLEILGSSGSIAEATLIQTARAMLAEEGYKETSVEINSIGDKESLNRFSKELTSYYRKQINEMSPEARQMFKRDPFELLASRESDCQELNSKAPKAMDFLTETSRRHLEEVLEYLEALDIPYVINNSLIGNRSYCTETIFSIINNPTEDKAKHRAILGIGVRYNGLAKRMNVKRDIQGVGLSLLVKDGGNGLKKPVTKAKKPIACFVQLGLESKLLSLSIIETLRKAKIPLHLSLAKDRLGAQVSSVEKYHTPYFIVMGKKEAVDRTAIVRKIDTHSQDIVPLKDLADYMKKIENNYFK
jgi:histidyl-tRNA synthetase